MILDDIQEKLLEIDPNVFYGTAEKLDRKKPWDYIVFSRRAMRPNSAKTGYADAFEVAIVREEFVPDGLPEKVIEAVTSIKGVRLADVNGVYDYVVKPNTSDTVEVLALEFVRPRKRLPDA
ncbi:hypothetical protein [Gordonibacter massiliensis (ex Traore et al. 2017)]|uniref:hypothetical protein n=1 Tax=Gordonibacter massiliensis (ex Traore et al. 2017) TaxID=1841863 RepID=UPI001C8B22DF|nr:hypothetical protein [Gordonibacter massiliensis (ex Traore et al. 2017)]MBX9032669.1 hypothetical protein [Gordonibacter massiliensis (ex Traore et al. 2017)]